MSKKKLACHCGGVEAEVEVPDSGFKKIMRCNCSICKRKGYIIGVAGPDDFRITKGENLLKLYQFHSKLPNIISVLFVVYTRIIDQESIQESTE